MGNTYPNYKEVPTTEAILCVMYVLWNSDEECERCSFLGLKMWPCAWPSNRSKRFRVFYLRAQQIVRTLRLAAIA